MRRTTVLILGALVIAGSSAIPAGADAGLDSGPEFTTVRKAGAAQNVTITGGGWGHGIGMSQYGAYGRALNGRTATEILEAYYKGAAVRSVGVPRTIRVGLLQGRSEISTTSSEYRPGGGAVSFKVAGASQEIADGNAGTQWRVEASSTGGMRLFRNGNKVKVDGKSVFGTPDHPLVMTFGRFGSLVGVSGKAYKYAYGKLMFGTYSTPCSSGAYCLRLVLKLPMQKYLLGLGEVPASWPAAALEAQAIAGRTYAYSKIKRVGQHLSPCDCAVYDSTIDQAYIGDSKRTGSGEYWEDWKNAVKATNRRVAMYQGDPIQALYSSSSGGYTENNENVWGGTPIPYLRGVRDRPDDVPANPNHTWKVEMTWAALRAKLDASWGIGKLEKFKLLRPFGVSGRVTVVKSSTAGGVKIVGSAKTVRVDGWEVRQVLGLKDTLFRVSTTTSGK